MGPPAIHSAASWFHGDASALSAGTGMAKDFNGVLLLLLLLLWLTELGGLCI
jgi:hypothetical protein